MDKRRSDTYAKAIFNLLFSYFQTLIIFDQITKLA